MDCHVWVVAVELCLCTRCNSIDVNWYRNNKPRSGYVANDTRATVNGADLVEHYSSLHPLPLGATVLEPDFHLNFAESQLTSDERALGQRQVLLSGELAFQLHQLVAAERRASTPASSMSLARRPSTSIIVGVTAFNVVVVVRIGRIGVSGVRPAEIVVGAVFAVWRRMRHDARILLRTNQVTLIRRRICWSTQYAHHIDT